MHYFLKVTFLNTGNNITDIITSRAPSPGGAPSQLQKKKKANKTVTRHSRDRARNWRSHLMFAAERRWS